jgi:hypothetical protein
MEGLKTQLAKLQIKYDAAIAKEADGGEMLVEGLVPGSGALDEPDTRRYPRDRPTKYSSSDEEEEELDYGGDTP